MRNDEEEIRALIERWMAATRTGDVDAVLSLMAEDAVFLLPGRPPMRKPEFAAAAKAQAADGAPQIDGHSEVQEIQVAGDWAFAWARLQVVVMSSNGSAPVERAGHTLTVFHRQQGRWLLARDANLLAPVKPSPP